MKGRDFGAFLIGALDVLLGEFPFFVEHFPETKFDFLAFFRHDLKGDIASDVLAEIKDFCAFWRDNDTFRKESFVLGDGDIIGGSGQNIALGFFRFRRIGRKTPSFENLPIFVIGKTNWAVARPIPRLISADCRHLPIFIRYFKLRI